MSAEELASLVKSMRDAQREYFRSRNQTQLQTCKDWERRVDRAVDTILNPPAPSLFEEPK